MKNLVKIIVVSAFGLGAVFALFANVGITSFGSVLAQVSPKPTPTPAAAATNTVANTVKTATADKKIPKSFTLGKDSLSEYGEVKFDHETHSSGKYSPDGKASIGCTECHHTDQPKSALKSPLVTSEREIALSLESWSASTQKVNECRACHFQDGNVPEGKAMPVLGGKDLTNEYAYHVNCNVCHDLAFKARPELKGKKGFATSKDCLICHTKN